MMFSNRSRHSGFTLVELAIVLAVAGVLFVGLWRLMSGGNQQVRDQSAASLQLQLIDSVKAFLASTNGQNLISNAATSSNPFILTLPTASPSSGSCISTFPAGATPDRADQEAVCNYLPPTFSTSTTNSYGQNYTKVGVYIGSANGGSYSFMIMSSGGDTIPDSSGGRISAAVGGDGGFIYSTAVCPSGAPNASYACGSYGTWYANPATYGLGSSSGHIASLSYVSSTQDSGLPWLERNRQIQPDPTYSWNTMSTDLFLSGTGASGNPSSIYMAGSGTTTGGGSLYMNGGNITLGSSKAATSTAGSFYANGGTINMGSTSGSTGGGTINLDSGQIVDGNASVFGSMVLTGNMSASGVNSVVYLNNGGCTRSSPNTGDPCQWVEQLTGALTVSDMLHANSLYAETFIYQTSDVRLKTNIHPITDALDDIMQLKPVSFNFKAGGEQGLGFIAQDIEKVYPELVSKGAGMKSVNYDGLIAPLVGAVQELKEENRELRQKIDAETAREAALEKKLKATASP